MRPVFFFFSLLLLPDQTFLAVLESRNPSIGKLLEVQKRGQSCNLCEVLGRVLSPPFLPHSVGRLLRRSVGGSVGRLAIK